MSKLKVACITASICILLGISGGIGIGWWLFHCKPGTVEAGDPGPLSPTDWKDNSSAALYAGDHIDIMGAMRQGNFFVTCSDKVKTNTREFPIKAICQSTYRPYSIQLQAFMLAGYEKDQQRFNSIAGGTIAFLWNYKYGSVGFGITYAQSIIFQEYYAGATIIGQIDFGKNKIGGSRD